MFTYKEYHSEVNNRSINCYPGVYIYNFGLIISLKPFLFIYSHSHYIYFLVDIIAWKSLQIIISIVPFHKDFSPSGEELEHRKLAHEL